MTDHIQRLLDIMARLRDPDGGCPWDVQQTFASIAPHTIEETYELVEAIEKNDPVAMREELGDVLLQVVFHAQMAREAGMFDFGAVAATIADKLVERHPHVFGERDNVRTAEDVLTNWETDKEAKRQAQAITESRDHSVLDNVSTALPAVTRAVKLQKRAARVGFDWNDPCEFLNKVREELEELETEIDADSPTERMQDELGDVLFAVIGLASQLGIDPETALRSTNRKFERRFRGVESALNVQGRTIADAPLEEMEQLWNEMKEEERKDPL